MNKLLRFTIINPQVRFHQFASNFNNFPFLYQQIYNFSEKLRADTSNEEQKDVNILEHNSGKPIYNGGEMLTKLGISPEQPAKFQEIKDKYNKYDFATEIESNFNKLREIGFSNSEITYILEKNVGILYPRVDKNGFFDLIKYIQDNWELNNEQIREVFYSNPALMSWPLENVIKNVEILQEYSITSSDWKNGIMIYPDIIRVHPSELTERLKRYMAYLGWNKEQLGEVLKNFPLLIGIPLKSILPHLRELRSRRLSPEILFNILKRDGRVLACKKSVLYGLFKYLTDELNVSSKWIADNILDKEPSFLLQNRQQVIRTKIKFLKANGVHIQLLKQMLRHTPQFFLQSSSAIITKTTYLIRRLEIDVANEPSFPLILQNNYRLVIKPRGEVMVSVGKLIPLHLAYNCSDEVFCERIGVDLEVLKEAMKAEGEDTGEQDNLWVYNKGAHLTSSEEGILLDQINDPNEEDLEETEDLEVTEDLEESEDLGEESESESDLSNIEINHVKE